MTTLLVIVIAGLLAAMGVLRNELQGLRADLEYQKVGERLRQVVQAPATAASIDPFRSSWKEAA